MGNYSIVVTEQDMVVVFTGNITGELSKGKWWEGTPEELVRVYILPAVRVNSRFVGDSQDVILEMRDYPFFDGPLRDALGVAATAPGASIAGVIGPAGPHCVYGQQPCHPSDCRACSMHQRRILAYAKTGQTLVTSQPPDHNKSEYIVFTGYQQTGSTTGYAVENPAFIYANAAIDLTDNPGVQYIDVYYDGSTGKPATIGDLQKWDIQITLVDPAGGGCIIQTPYIYDIDPTNKKIVVAVKIGTAAASGVTSIAVRIEI
jgi:hypothetical protein